MSATDAGDGPRKRRKLSVDEEEPEVDTDTRLAILQSLFPDRTPEVLFDYLLAYNGSIEDVSRALSAPAKADVQSKRSATATGYQSSLSTFVQSGPDGSASARAAKLLTKKGKTLHLYGAEEIERHCPCSIIHNFLPSKDADALLKELLQEQPTFRREKFVLFDREVQSPHSARFYVNSLTEVTEHQTEYYYNGGQVLDVGQTTPEMLKTGDVVKATVNGEIKRRTRDFQPSGRRLKFQSDEEWKPNVSFVNCYDGGKESVGWHSDQLTYLGPRAVIGSISLGVAREFRIRRVVPQVDGSSADDQGQIAIHLPHNSLLIMHADMQEGWKHSIAPATVIDEHPIAGSKRFNITYRFYRSYLHPKFTPRCPCNVPCVLRCVQKRQASLGRYMWQCHAGYISGQPGCSFYRWAEFDEDGRPPWVDGYQGNSNTPA